MLYDALLTEQEKALRDEVRRFVRDEVPADLLRAMDREEITFPIADAMTRLDAARGLVYGAAKTVDRGMPHRRLVSEAKKFSTEAAWWIVNTAMQVLGGIGYTNVYPLERYLRDCRLGLIWTGTSQIMDALIQHEIYAEFLGDLRDRRNVEMDAMGIDFQKEKIYTDEDMWRNF